MRQVQIIKICKKLTKLWLLHPSLRLAQILTCIVANGLDKELYDYTDKELYLEIEKEIKRCRHSEKSK